MLLRTGLAALVATCAACSAFYPTGPCKQQLNVDVTPAQACLSLRGEVGANGTYAIEGANHCAGALDVHGAADGGALAFPADGAVSISLGDGSALDGGAWTLPANLGTVPITITATKSSVCPD